MTDRYGSGGAEENLDFTMGLDTSASHSCSAILNGELFLFGGTGSIQKQTQVIFLNLITIKIYSSFQISKIVGCTLKRIGALPDEFDRGACGTFLFDGDERVMFCFAASNQKKCFR